MAEGAAQRRGRSPNYPAQPLGWAVETGLALLEKENTHAVSPDIVANNLGYKDSNNGNARRALANLKAFGILQRASGGKLAVSKEVRRFKLHPTDADKAVIVKQWLKKPLLFSKLLEKYGDDLPSDRALVFELVDEHGFLEAGAQKAIDVFRASIDYAEQIAGPVDLEPASEEDCEDNDFDEPEAEESEADSEQAASAHTSSAAHRQQVPAAPSPPLREGVRYPVRLAGGRMAWIDVPDPFYEADKNRLKAQLEVIGTVDEDEAFLDKDM